MELNMKKMVNLRMALGLMFVFAVAGCKAPPKMTDDTIVSSTVDGVTLSHRYAVQPPAQFSPVNEAYRALYPASIMTRPSFGGKVVDTLKSGETYTVIGQVENNWLALGEQAQAADEAQPEAAATDDKKAQQPAAQPAVQLIGYVPFRAVVKSALYEQTIKADQPKRRARASSKKKTCVAVDGDSKACQNSNSGTWIIN
ncbi:SH3 domain-containing protein [Pantoea dispersa]|uniref:SH3 domain-containing protein n=1 Tax=Pantoea dispersa TaxID=59814 RepID=UPI002DB9C9AD|nr:SH3 domain-containing protein [Pantoea dispersa]MEB5972697.1 SH3 domain-containing protein [Pantoea dispersa]